jgi:chorismate mutase
LSAASGTERAAAPSAGASAVGIAAAGREQITAERDHIDALDRRILELIEERVAVSHRIQAARLGSGGRRTDTRREQEIIARYAERFGRSGTRLSLILLELSRGALPEPGAQN